MTAKPTERLDRQAPRDPRLKDLVAACKTPAIRAVSVDIFDTLLWRTVPRPVDVFSFVGERLWAMGALSPSLTFDGFRSLRETAETHAREERMRLHEQSEVRLDEIYELIPSWVFADKLTPTEAAGVEVQLEIELVLPDLDVVALLLSAQESGKLIVATSDTYFSEGHIRALLTQPGVGALQFDRIFSSSDHRLNKSGGLHEIVVRELALQPEQVLHFGDNPGADVDPPRALGMHAEHLERHPGELDDVLEREAELLRMPPGALAHLRAAGTLAAVRAKAASRPEQAELPDGLRPYWNYGATILGPVFAGFAEWVHARCAEAETKKVLCLMREGSFLGELIEGANAYLGDELTAVPLWINRKLALRAALTDVDRHSLRLLLSRRTPQTVAGFLRMLGLDPADVPAFAAQLDSTLIDPVVRHGVIEHLSEEPRLRSQILAESRRLRDAITRLIEIHAPGGGPITMVDLGWGATIQGNVGRALAEAGMPRETVGLYMLTGEHAGRQVMEGAEIHGFLGDFGEPQHLVETVLRSPEILEQVCMPPHGSQLDLTANLDPVVGPAAASSVQQVEAETVRAGILAFQREWGQLHAVLPQKLGDLDEARRQVLQAVALRSVVVPTAAEAEIFGRWHHDESDDATEIDYVADPRQLPRLRHMAPEQLRDLPMSQLYWPFGLAAQVDEHWPALMSAAAAGLIPWDSMGSELESGSFTVAASKGVDVESSKVEVTPIRNRFGLSAVNATLSAPQITEVSFHPAERPCVLRIDWIDIACHAQGHATPMHVRLDASGGLERLVRGNIYAIAPNLLVVHGGGPVLSFDVTTVTPRVVSQVDVEVAFAVLPIGGVLPAEGRFVDLEVAAEAVVEAAQDVAAAREQMHVVYNSLSWRVTRPLRALKRFSR